MFKQKNQIKPAFYIKNMNFNKTNHTKDSSVESLDKSNEFQKPKSKNLILEIQEPTHEKPPRFKDIVNKSINANSFQKVSN